MIAESGYMALSGSAIGCSGRRESHNLSVSRFVDSGDHQNPRARYAVGNPFSLVLTPRQDHHLTCAEPLLETAESARPHRRRRSVDRHTQWAGNKHFSDPAKG